jgi:hypothetical protein
LIRWAALLITLYGFEIQGIPILTARAFLEWLAEEQEAGSG